ncbi:hypothetical protein CW745_10435 [Psychromonas sp. psych-6C06]|uniref:glycosyltransferase n=1 Tax=Psychromonas sp. psych-6C06 TaxID=2058089 RepID=UPI000C34B333|nr:glycosyltransferase [Psychromonas sp. psych-6C06]PKF61727.1 hypothetical protein CW745_10435 [Psychromonas sp. psych-6C06]
MISVCMATYNGEKYIFKQLESILSQLEVDDELIISDNLSDDGTLEIIKSFNDQRIKLFTLEHDPILLQSFKGVEKTITKNFENALKRAKGEYIFLSDQDDIWNKNKVAESIKHLGKYDLVMSNAELIDGHGNTVKDKLYNDNPINAKVLSFRHRGCLLAFKRNILSISLPFPKNLLYHDYWIGILAESAGQTLFIDQPLVLHRRGIGNVSTDVTQGSNNSFFYKIKYRTIYFILCFNRIILNR